MCGRLLVRRVSAEAAAALSVLPRQNPFARPVTVWLRDLHRFRHPCATIELDGRIFRTPPRPDVVHRIVVWHLARQRTGTASSKDRSEVRGSRRKLYAQKGTGRARVGSSRAPHRRGGGVCFGPKPRDFAFPLSPKVRALGLRSALASRLQSGQLAVVADQAVDGYADSKTRTLVGLVEEQLRAKKVLLVDSQPLPRSLELASASLRPAFRFVNLQQTSLNAYHVLDNTLLLVTQRAVALLNTQILQHS
jgi:large subunit ribosomal protein L4